MHRRPRLRRRQLCLTVHSEQLRPGPGVPRRRPLHAARVHRPSFPDLPSELPLQHLVGRLRTPAMRLTLPMRHRSLLPGPLLRPRRLLHAPELLLQALKSGWTLDTAGPTI